MLVSVHTAEREMKTKKPKALANFRFFLASCEANMVGRVGFEPTTNWLKANCSTN